MPTILAAETYLQKKSPQVNIKKTLLVPITSDKGLCGSTNSVIIKQVKLKVLKNRDEFKVFYQSNLDFRDRK